MRPTHTNDGQYVPLHEVSIDVSMARQAAEYGSISIDLCDMVLRVNNGVCPGGVGIIPIFGNQDGVTGLIEELQRGPVAPVTGLSGNSTVTHNLGRFPIVQLVDASGNIANALGAVTHVDENRVMVVPTSPTATYTVVFG